MNGRHRDLCQHRSPGDLVGLQDNVPLGCIATVTSAPATPSSAWEQQSRWWASMSKPDVRRTASPHACSRFTTAINHNTGTPLSSNAATSPLCHCMRSLSGRFSAKTNSTRSAHGLIPLSCGYATGQETSLWPGILRGSDKATCAFGSTYSPLVKVGVWSSGSGRSRYCIGGAE